MIRKDGCKLVSRVFTIKYSEPEKITDPKELNNHGFSVQSINRIINNPQKVKKNNIFLQWENLGQIHL